jgi:hypothetical protein
VVWDNLQNKLNGEEKIPGKGNLIFLNLKRLAVAAVITGVAIATWLLLRNTNNADSDVVQGDVPPVENKITVVPAQPKTENPTNDTNRENKLLVSVLPKKDLPKNKIPKKNTTSFSKQATVAQQEKSEAIVLQKNIQEEKTFDKEIDDLSLITAGDNYMTMVNANGRLSKIPAQFAHLAPHLQDKPVTEDYSEILFGEGTYWKETLNEWRKKIASVPVSSGDAFTSFIELLKTVQNK